MNTGEMRFVKEKGLQTLPSVRRLAAEQEGTATFPVRRGREELKEGSAVDLRVLTQPGLLQAGNVDFAVDQLLCDQGLLAAQGLHVTRDNIDRKTSDGWP